MSKPGFKHGRDLTAAITHVVSSGPVDMAVAYWGSKACDHLNLPQDLAGYRIACDAYSGFCSPAAIKELLHRNAQVVDVPLLHAKVYLSGRGVVSASANASTRGLSGAPDSSFGLEAGIFDCELSHLDKARDWFSHTFKSGRTVTLGDLSRIEEVWNRQRSTVQLRTSLMEAILTRSSLLADRALRVSVYRAEEPSDEVQNIFKRTPYFDAKKWSSTSSYPFFWGEMPKVSPGDVLLCFELDGGKVMYEGVWTILDRVGNGEKTVWPVALTKLSFVPQLGPVSEVCRRTTEAVRTGALRPDAGPISLTEFAAAIAAPDMQASHLECIQRDKAREAYRLLVRHAPELGLAVSYKSGHVPAVRLHDVRGRYLFSFIPNKDDLLFYVRKPAIKAGGYLAEQARSLGLKSQQNRSGEETLRLEDAIQAGRVIEWLRTVMPL